ncbi:MAG: translation initiation factor [Opitutaceae bacterium]|jgi:translation initiation factor 1|nr:translation initiation factor [Opitutaceae bacterium]
MSRPEKGKISTGGGAELGQNPFASAFGGLDKLANLPAGPGNSGGGEATKSGEPAAKEKNRGRVDVLRTTAGRGGKTVTVARGFVGIGLPEKEALCKKMRSSAGCGGTVKDGEIEIQGDQREVVSRVLREAGFRVVLAGG